MRKQLKFNTQTARVNSKWYKMIDGVETPIWYCGKILNHCAFSLKPMKRTKYSWDVEDDTKVTIFRWGVLIYKYPVNN